MKREHFCYGSSIEGVVFFVRDVDSNVQLFDQTRLEGEMSRRACLTARIGHSPRPQDEYICYWSNKDGSTGFALDINKNVQLFPKADAEASAKIHKCKIAKVGFVGIGKDGMPLAST